MADPVTEVETELNRQVGFLRTHRDPDTTLADVLKSHRRQVLANLIDDGDAMWLQRNGVLERLADRHGIDLSSEPSVHQVIAAHTKGQTAMDVGLT